MLLKDILEVRTYTLAPEAHVYILYSLYRKIEEAIKPIRSLKSISQKSGLRNLTIFFLVRR